MDNRRGTPRKEAHLAKGNWNAGLVVLAIVVVIVVVAVVLSRCSEETPDGSGRRDVPLVVEASSEEALAREEYINSWAERIDAYNEGTPLAGYGATFAAAAYDCGIDPRIAPAIARVESGSGANCFRPHNAWGWGSVSWSDWDSAIWGFVQGFSEDYGAELTYAAAQSYNKVNTDEWYAQVTSCMSEVWAENSL